MEVRKMFLYLIISFVELSAFEYTSPRIVVEGAWGKGKSEFGVKKGDMGYYFPSNYTVDCLGNIYVMDTWNHRIKKYSSRGNLVSIFETEDLVYGGYIIGKDTLYFFSKVNGKKGWYYLDPVSWKAVLIKRRTKEDLSSIGVDGLGNVYKEDPKIIKGPVDTLKGEYVKWRMGEGFARIIITRERHVIMIVDVCNNLLGKVLTPWSVWRTIFYPYFGDGYEAFKTEIVEIYYTYVGQFRYNQCRVDCNGNLYLAGLKPNKYFILKYSRIHYLPHVIDTVNYTITELRIDSLGNVYYYSSTKWNNSPPQLPSTGGFKVKEYSYVPPKKIKETGFRIYRGDSLMGRWKSYYKKPVKEVKYLGEDSLRRYWVYVGMDGYWEVMRYGWDRAWKKYTWCWVLSSSRVKEGIPGIMDKDRIDIKRFRVGWDGHLYYRDKGRWYKQEDIQREEFIESEVKRLALIESKIHVKPYIEYEPVDSAEFERGIKITRKGKLIRKFKYLSIVTGILFTQLKILA